MIAEFRDSSDGIIEGGKPEGFCKESSTSDSYRSLSDTRPTSPTDNERPPKLLDQMKEALRTRHYSPRTESTYCQWVKRFIFFHNVRHPAEMAEPEINAFLTHLAPLSALLFLYRKVLGREIGALGEIIRAKKAKRLPVVMTREELREVLNCLAQDKK